MENRVKENKEVFLGIAKQIKRPGIEKLITWIEEKSDFFVAPASTMFHGNYEGGLCEHSLNVYKLFKEKNERYDLGLDEDSVAIMALFHDLCKANFYKLSSRNKKIDGKWVAVPWYDVEDSLPLGHGDKSVIMLQNFIRLTQEEMLGIRWHMGGYVNKDDYRTLSNAWDKCKSGACLHTADLEASNLFEVHVDYEKANTQVKLDI